jgi:hypothetical protein
MSDGMIFEDNKIVFDSIEEIDKTLEIYGEFEKSNPDVWEFINYEFNNIRTDKTIEITVVKDNKNTTYLGKFDGAVIDFGKGTEGIIIDIDFLIMEKK